MKVALPPGRCNVSPGLEARGHRWVRSSRPLTRTTRRRTGPAPAGGADPTATDFRRRSHPWRELWGQRSRHEGDRARDRAREIVTSPSCLQRVMVRDVIRTLGPDGWCLDGEVGSRRQLRHPDRPGTVAAYGRAAEGGPASRDGAGRAAPPSGDPGRRGVLQPREGPLGAGALVAQDAKHTRPEETRTWSSQPGRSSPWLPSEASMREELLTSLLAFMM